MQNNRTTASLTDTSVKNALTPSTTDGSEQTRKEPGLKNKKQKRAQKHKTKTEKSKNTCKADEEDSEDISCLYCFGTSTEMCVQCTDCKLRSDEECTDGSSNCVCLKLSI
jgi:hypothetical protein